MIEGVPSKLRLGWGFWMYMGQVESSEATRIPIPNAVAQHQENDVMKPHLGLILRNRWKQSCKFGLFGLPAAGLCGSRLFLYAIILPLIAAAVAAQIEL